MKPITYSNVSTFTAKVCNRKKTICSEVLLSKPCLLLQDVETNKAVRMLLHWITYISLFGSEFRLHTSLNDSFSSFLYILFYLPIALLYYATATWSSVC